MERFVFSPDWPPFVAYIEQEIYRNLRSLAKTTDTAEIYRLQGAISVLQKLVDLRERLKANSGD